MTEKIVQTAGRDALGNFAPNFAHYNDMYCLAIIGTTRTLI